MTERNYKVGTKLRSSFGLLEIIELQDEGAIVKWHKHPKGWRFDTSGLIVETHDFLKTCIDEEVYNSPLYQAMKEEK